MPTREQIEAELLRGYRKQRPPITDPFYCPLCGFTMIDDLDGHFLPCLVRRARSVSFAAMAELVDALA